MCAEIPAPYPLLSALGDIDVDRFLAEYWQRKPLLVRQAFANFDNPLSGDELAGLAVEEGVESRLITRTSGKRGEQWQVEHGPLKASRFAKLPERDWTLLVQHVDSLDPGVNALLQAFRFLPNWRLDDIMISFAPDGGGVGPHFDYYDVFLLQAEGKRRWRLGQWCDANTPLVPDQPMKLLQHFDTTEDWVLEPGDLLYVPARLAHWGEAVGACMTYSIGFRAPSHADFLLDFAQETASLWTQDQRYADPGLLRQAQAGELPTSALNHFGEVLRALSEDKAALAQWLGRFSSELKQEFISDEDAPSAAALPRLGGLSLSRYARVCFSTVARQTWLFVNGESWPCSRHLAENLSAYRAVTWATLGDEDRALLTALAERGLLIEVERA